MRSSGVRGPRDSVVPCALCAKREPASSMHSFEFGLNAAQNDAGDSSAAAAETAEDRAADLHTGVGNDDNNDDVCSDRLVRTQIICSGCVRMISSRNFLLETTAEPMSAPSVQSVFHGAGATGPHEPKSDEEVSSPVMPEDVEDVVTDGQGDPGPFVPDDDDVYVAAAMEVIIGDEDGDDGGSGDALPDFSQYFEAVLAGAGEDHQRSSDDRGIPEEPATPPRNACRLCGRSYASPRGLKLHVSKSHGNDGNDKAPVPRDPRAGRGGKVVGTPSRPRRAAIDGRPAVACDVCGLEFADSGGLGRHRYTKHVLGGGRPFPCLFCAENFNWRDDLYRHLGKVHFPAPEHRDGAFPCGFCGKTFKSLAGLHAHRIHMHRDRVLAAVGDQGSDAGGNGPEAGAGHGAAAVVEGDGNIFSL